MKASFFLLPILALAVACQGTQKEEFAALYEGLPFDMPRVELPSILDRSVVLTDFGGVADGVALNTDAFAAATSGDRSRYLFIVSDFSFQD